MRFDRKQFYAGFKRKILSKLEQSQVDGINFLLDAFERAPEWSSIRHIAYAFATIAHETAWTFRPIKEYRAKVGTDARRKQDRYWPSGFYGRGYVQLTWPDNYAKAEDELGVPLSKQPDLALDPGVAFRILTRGMFEGWFTGHDLGDHINAKKTDYFNARKIINKLDKAEQIASLAKRFEAVLRLAEAEDIEDLSDQEIDEIEIPAAEPRQDPPVELPEDHAVKLVGEQAADKATAEAQQNSGQRTEAIVNVGTETTVPANLVPEEKTADAPPPTGFMSKLKAQGAALLATIGGAAGLKEWLGIQLSAETVELLKVLVPTVLGLGFIGFLVWYVAEKIIGFKTLKLQSDINTDPNRHNLRIRPQ